MVTLTSVAVAQKVSLDQFKSWKPRNIGPAGMSGRITAIDAVVSNPNQIWLGAASGGVWKTNNAGGSWESVFDDQPTLNIGSVAIQQSNPSVVWVGTGEGNPRNSINTDSERRDGHLKSDDFFNSEKFPQMKFVSTSMKPLGGNKYALSGNLTIRDITKPVTFDVTYGGQIKTQNGGAKAGFKAKTTVDRLAFGLKWDRALETGSLVVGKDVEVTILVEMDLQK